MLIMMSAVLVTAALIALMLRRRDEALILAEHVIEKISTHDADGTFRYVSPVFASMLGAKPEALIGRNPRDFAHPEDAPAVDGLWKRAIDWNASAPTITWRCRRHDGAYEWLETTARGTDPKVKSLGAIVCATRNITERKQIEDALRDSERRFRTTLEAVRLVAVGLNTQGRITFCNEALVLLSGWSRTDLIGENWFDRCVPAGDPIRNAFYANIASGTVPTKYEGELLCKDGSRRLVEWDTTVLKSPGGDIVGTASLGVDLTERRAYETRLVEARDEAERANKAKSDFLSRMSHELRTPLNSVIGFANVMRKNKHGRLGTDDITFLDRITANGKHLLQLVNNVLDISKVEAGRLTVTATMVNVDELAKDVVAQLEGQPRAPGVVLKADVPDDLVPIESDHVLLRQVLINLVSNAIKFTRQGSVVISVEGDKEGTPRTIRVTDTGIGIPANRLGAIFEPFEQAGTDTHAQYGGTGLGLSISKAICEALGYEVSVQSEVGKGSTFSVSLLNNPQ
jgi:PAS domain S-box-containing protein